uniref:RNA/RNP complex-1-interacting phosphatase n=1 Tax=Leptobrachium leishanense TaxID=445787 RepID=A0A8C5N3Q0_9ANUR
MVKKNSIPERWRNLSSVGQRLPGSRFIAFKVPLKGVINQRVTQIQKFTPKDLLSAIRNMNEELGLVIDLTNTERYYTIKDLPKSVQYVKMHTAGLKIPDDSTIHQFKRIVRRFIWNNSENDKLIGVHCTTGINRTGYLICRYLIDVDGWEPETAVNTFNDCRGHPIEASVYREDLISGATRSNLGIDQPPSDDTTIPMRRDSSDEEVSHPYSADRRKAIEAFMEARKRTEHQQTVRKIAAQNALRDEFGDFDARDKMQDFDARESMQDWRQMPLPMRDRSPDYHDIDFMNSMAGPRDRPFPPREAMDDCDFPGPFEHRERFFRGNMRDQDMMHPDEYRRMQYERREMRGGHPMEFGSDMYMENCDLEMGPRDMRENMDYDHGRQMGRFGNQPGPSRMFSEEDDFEDGPGGPMSRPFPGPFGRGGASMSNDEIEEMEARRRFERNRAMKSQCAMDTDQRRSIDHGAHHREAAHMPGPMRSRPVDGPPNERMHPMGPNSRRGGDSSYGRAVLQDTLLSVREHYWPSVWRTSLPRANRTSLHSGPHQAPLTDGEDGSVQC